MSKSSILLIVASASLFLGCARFRQGAVDRVAGFVDDVTKEAAHRKVERIAGEYAAARWREGGILALAAAVYKLVMKRRKEKREDEMFEMRARNREDRERLRSVQREHTDA